MTSRIPKTAAFAWIAAILTVGVVCEWTAFAQAKPARESVAIMPFEAVEASTAEVAAISDRLRDLLIRTGKFQVMDRAQMDALLKEQAFEQANCTTTECAVKAGKVLGVRKLITGKIIKLDPSHWLMSAALIDVETSETSSAPSIPHEGSFFEFLQNGVPKLADLLAGPSERESPVPAVPAVAPAVPEAPAAVPTVPAVVPAVPLQAGQTWRDPVTGMEFVWVEGGSFEMGCGSWDRDCFKWEKPSHRVTVSSFWMGKTEVTQGQWTRIMRGNPSQFKNGDNFPVERVTWDEARKFISTLNSKSSGVTFRLPREAEWEYACRSRGKEQVYGTQSGDLSEAGANTREAGNRATTPVGSFPPNGLGLFDMSGNVWEWVQDAYHDYSSGPATGPVAESGAGRVNRGGGWREKARYARCSYRINGSASNRYPNMGFRVVRAR